jgi:hypothetical protein
MGYKRRKRKPASGAACAGSNRHEGLKSIALASCGKSPARTAQGSEVFIGMLQFANASSLRSGRGLILVNPWKDRSDFISDFRNDA